MTHVLVTGGVRSGKSRYAESLLAADAAVTYLTPGYPADAVDAEWAARVAAHRLRRPPAWQTIESLDLAVTLRAVDGPVLIDCLGTWLTGLFDAWDAWEGDTLHAVVQFVETPFAYRFTARFTDDGAEVDLRANVSFGPTHLGRIALTTAP